MKNPDTICENKYVTKDGAKIGVCAKRTKGGRFAVCIYWPAGLDSSPSVKWFETNEDALAGYVVACQWIADRYAA